ncbi:MAG: nucleotidyl transferase AbiEii/AbiGii toxin family protein [Spirochaetales bacterium]|uniref:Nucleotidyl transferase AbiEii/AbiGii toxin family protein n=1 Tax=Candidatus Thalassospirochaeta sargassi TaxID=3119039 RepID=A0AAJ1IEM7_9SPIO|nr:nucleotidyl transferase AbiEii/AbiGii toxin family protein [Spirochaetales bacterium]
MNKIAGLSDKDRMDLFRATSQKMGINEAIIEKDFWVCWTLDYLFHKSDWKGQLSFKGGTSLSKAYNLIERFSEDIDLIIDWTLLGYQAGEPWDARSNTKQDKFNEEANQKAVQFLIDSFAPVLKADFSDILGCEVEVSADKHQNVRFTYPRSFSNDSILQTILLEIGPLAAWVPSEEKVIKPYSADFYPDVFEQAETSIRTVMAKRTFWEKATILHQEAHRDTSKSLPPRYSRHYYDLHRMADTQVKIDALNDLKLLEDVVEFKKRFYRCPWARYDDAFPGTFRLSPSEHHLEELKKDYESMQSMLFGDKPDFTDILNSIGELEVEINSL